MAFRPTMKSEVSARVRAFLRWRPRDETSHEPVGGAAKRTIDVMGSLLLIMLLAPVMIGAAILVRLLVGRPIIFPQKRIGLGGDHFVCYKFRTMVVGGDMVLGRYPAANPAAAELRDDPRVCSVAEVLRKSNLDELPQLFNVLRGDMSFVGPRPVVDEETRHYGPYFEECFRARPGLSGLWQVSGPKGRQLRAARRPRPLLCPPLVDLAGHARYSEDHS